MARDETESTVSCQPDLFPRQIHGRAEPCGSCRSFRPKHREEKVLIVSLEADFYRYDKWPPILSVATCADGRRFIVGEEQVTRARIAKWKATTNTYSECGNDYRKETYLPNGSATMTVNTENEVTSECRSGT